MAPRGRPLTGGAVFEVLVRVASGALVDLDCLQDAEQTVAGAACGGVDDDPRALRRAGPRDGRSKEPSPLRRPRSCSPHGPPAPRARREVLQGGLTRRDAAGIYCTRGPLRCRRSRRARSQSAARATLAPEESGRGDRATAPDE